MQRSAAVSCLWLRKLSRVRPECSPTTSSQQQARKGEYGSIMHDVGLQFYHSLRERSRRCRHGDSSGVTQSGHGAGKDGTASL